MERHDLLRQCLKGPAERKKRNGFAPPYLSDLLHIHTPVKRRRSDAPKSTLRNRCGHPFSRADPIPWNSLHMQIRSAQVLKVLKFDSEFDLGHEPSKVS